MDFKDYYATLGVGKAATEKEIKQAFRRLARKYHPDVNPGDKTAEAKFKEINEANEVLSDPSKRQRYDELGANWRAYEQAASAGGPQAAGWGAYAGGAPQGGFRTMTPEEMHEMFGDSDPFSDFFHAFFGGAPAREGPKRARPARGRGPRNGSDIEHEIDLTLGEAYHGATRRLTIKHDGHARSVDVRIPVGVGDGSRVRIAGEGEPGSGGGRSGDLYLRLRVAPHPIFTPKGRDLHTRVGVPLTTAVLGGEAEVPTLAGKALRLKIPAGTQHGQVFRLKGHGMPAGRGGDEGGDLYATVDVPLPKELSPEERAHFEALRKLEKGGAKPSAA